jgi:hypothetical protein
MASLAGCKFGRGTLPAFCTGSRGQTDGTFGHISRTTVFSPRLAPDDDTRVAEVLTHFVVAGGKIDERASFLASPFFPAKNPEANFWC